jgi:HAE1 family hydrophobic/amphiphilic exporter-1
MWSSSKPPKPRPPSHEHPAVSLLDTFIHRPIATSLLAGSLLLAGLAAYPRLPVASVPQVDFPTISVYAGLPGANPEIMAATVASPLERQFSQISGLTQMTSNSDLSSTYITLQFDLDRSIDGVAQDVQTAINAAAGQLPTNLPSPPTYYKVNPGDAPVIVLRISSQSLPMSMVSDYASNILIPNIAQIPGVGQASLFGEQKPAVRIQIDPTKIAGMGLDLETVRAQVAAATTNAPKGVIDGPRQSMAVYDNDQLFTAEAWNTVIVADRAGAPIRIRDIGQAIDGVENAKLAAWAYAGPAWPPGMAIGNGQTIILGVSRQPGSNLVDVVNRVKAELPRLKASLPASIDIDVAFDRTPSIEASIRDVQFTLLLTVALVVAAIFVFLRNVTATVIPALTVPLALFGTMAVMYLLGYSLDNLSLIALTIAIGFVVDDAIVMLENIFRHVEEGMPPLEAAVKGAREIGFTIVSISLSLIAVFIPILFMGGIVGRFLREFGITVSLTVLVSMIVSLAFTPMLCGRFLKRPVKTDMSRLFALFESGFDRMQNGYRRWLGGVLRRQRMTFAVFLLTLAASVWLYTAIPKGFFPQADTGEIAGAAQAAQDISYAGMCEKMEGVADIVRRDPDVAAFSYNFNSGPLNQVSIFLSLKPLEEGRKTSSDAIIARLRPQMAKLTGINLFLQSIQDVTVGARLSSTQYQYTLTDPDLGELDTWAPRLLDGFRALPQLTDVASDLQNGAYSAVATIDRDQAARFGIQPALIDATIYDAIGQRQVAQYYTQVNSYHVVFEVTPALQGDPDLFSKIYLTSPTTGGQVPLSAMVKLDMSKKNYLAIHHQGQSPAVTLSFNLAPGVSLGQAVDAIDGLKARLGAPASLNGSFQGTAQAFRATLATQPYLIAAALIAVYVILGILYESYIHPLTILSTLPSAGVGALLLLWITGYDLSLIALVGILLLIGIVKKNGIMMVDVALQAERAGMTPEEAIFHACALRFRPIMMTTVCALLAGVPLMLATGTGSEFRQPLGVAMVGGLIFSQALTLFTTPVVYLYLDRVNRRLENWWRGRGPFSERRA